MWAEVKYTAKGAVENPPFKESFVKSTKLCKVQPVLFTAFFAHVFQDIKMIFIIYEVSDGGIS